MLTHDPLGVCAWMSTVALTVPLRVMYAVNRWRLVVVNVSEPAPEAVTALNKTLLARVLMGSFAYKKGGSKGENS